MNPEAAFIHSEEHDVGLENFVTSDTPPTRHHHADPNVVSSAPPRWFHPADSTTGHARTPLSDADESSSRLLQLPALQLLLEDLNVFVARKEAEEVEMRRHIHDLEVALHRTGGAKLLVAPQGKGGGGDADSFRQLPHCADKAMGSRREAELALALRDAQTRADELALETSARAREVSRLQEEHRAELAKAAARERCLEGDLRDAISRVEVARSETEHERARAEKLRIECVHVHDEMVDAKAQSDREVAKLVAEIASKDHEIDSLQRDIEDREGAMHREAKRHREREEALQRSCAQTDKQRVESEGELQFTIVRLRREVQGLKDELDIVRRDKAGAMADEIVARDRAIEELRQANHALKQEVESLQKTATSNSVDAPMTNALDSHPCTPPPIDVSASSKPCPMGPKVRALVEANVDLQKQLVESRAALVELRREKTELLDDAADKARHIARLQERVDPAEVAELRRQLTQCRTNEASLRAQVTELRLVSSTPTDSRHTTASAAPTNTMSPVQILRRRL